MIFDLFVLGVGALGRKIKDCNMMIEGNKILKDRESKSLWQQARENCSMITIRQSNQCTMVPETEYFSVLFVSSLEIREYSCVLRLSKRKNLLVLGRRFPHKSAFFSGAAPDRRILSYCEWRATKPMITPVAEKTIVH